MKSLRNFPDPFLAEICCQPAALRRAAQALEEQVEGLRALGQARARCRRLLFTGMGASYHACYPAISELAGRGVAALLVDAAELLHFRRPLLDAGTLIVAVSQSGESAELVRLAEAIQGQAREDRAFLASVTNGTRNALAARAELAFDTLAGREAGPSTITFAASLVILSGLARLLAGDGVSEAAARTSAAASSAAAAADRLLADPEGRAEELLAWHRGRTTAVLLGRGPARAAAEMGALLLKEAAGIPAEALEAAQFRHGPLELAGPDLAAVVFATERETVALDANLASDLALAGSAVLLVSSQNRTSPPPEVRVVEIGSVDRTLSPTVSILPVQLLAWRLAVERGRTPGELTRAAKVTTHE
jgi:glucosamine--fructose-6-phosphate aminotransferase (isomerizing)